MSESVADVLWSMLASAGVKRCYGIVGDALDPVIDALRRDGRVEFIQVRNEEAGVFAAVAEASLTGNLVAVCGTAGPGAMHLLNGLMDAQREGVPVIAIAGDTVSGLIDSGTIEEINPYTMFQIASLYTGRLVNPAQNRTVVQTAIRTALGEHGPTVIAVPGDVAVSKVPDDSYQAVTHNPRYCGPAMGICAGWPR
jgi:pyruvate dehydrogenase (quinone)